MNGERTVKLTPRGLAQAIDNAFAADVILYVEGQPGSGKSQIIEAGIIRNNLAPIVEIASTLDITDWRGVPDIDRKRKATVFYAPAFLPREGDPVSCVFFDEASQIPPSCQPPLYQILLNRRLGTVWKAPAGTRIICAGNSKQDGTFAQTFGAALRDRVFRVVLEPDPNDWYDWAYGAGIEPGIIAFLKFRPTLLHKFDKNEWASPTCRGWEMVSRVLTNAVHPGDPTLAMVAGKVGYPAATELMAFLRMFNTLPDIDSIIANPYTAATPSERQPELFYAVSNALAHRADLSNIDSIVAYLDRLPSEYGAFAMRLIGRDKNAAVHNSAAYTQWVIRHADDLNP